MSTDPSQPRALTLTALDGRLAICRLDAAAPVPPWATDGPFWSVTRTDEELSVVCPEDAVPDGVVRDRGWVGLRVEGPLDLAWTAVLASLARPLSEAGIALFAISTHDTDTLLIKAVDVDRAVGALESRGHRVVRRRGHRT